MHSSGSSGATRSAVTALARPGRIEVTGEVPDVADWLCRAQVAVAPLQIAAGMPNKLAQAMACDLREARGSSRDDPAGFAALWTWEAHFEQLEKVLIELAAI